MFPLPPLGVLSAGGMCESMLPLQADSKLEDKRSGLSLWLGLGPASCDPAEKMSGFHPASTAETLTALPVWPLREAIIFSYLP